ncbi:MAG: hypothetical protein JO322_07955 [Candidatus Eremiobacteraeota bacterium]|nr:hypothetical protein [Candidatus Eremiobacteraeota bacterium]
MRKTLGLLAAFLVTGMPIDSPAQVTSGPAPADEYFGTLHQSILEIRNRLDRLESRADSEMYDSDIRHEIDDVTGSILDWQRRYPNDPWLPHTFARALMQYHRAGAASSARAAQALAVMRQSYPNSDETARTLALMNDAPASTPGTGVWMRFDSMRTTGSDDQPPND